MDTTWIDVVHDLVKIGVGALVGAGGAVWLAFIKRDSDTQKETRERRARILEAVSEELGNVLVAVTAQLVGAAAATANFASKVGQDDLHLEKRKLHLSELTTPLIQLQIVDSRARLLGLSGIANDVNELMEEIKACAGEIRAWSSDSDADPVVNIRVRLKEIQRKRQSIYSRIALEFSRI
jgi:hypothetical protein